ncbi:unnamed protein product [Didymodactylos carnosus]|uniref:Tubulin beta chain n=1 Tax=Didymodactylos carnosus TaxID=1234261 RepID=A0A814D5X4_9BILA|nr:unnamed protein product [Didymodactylos carnosus]CAF1003715.1 unnamed protein product [Didymodactylos carnosus]CAF3725555.1 unnamed protein product [Didymodactylos carnosus]CAF3773029.1 unnamed protein product [Didymodactylos carnosus]
MREIITIQVGQAGNSIGRKFWEVACDEHGIAPNGLFHGESDLQLERINVYFTEAMGGRYVPRVIATDLEAGSIDTLRRSPFGQIYNPELLVHGTTGASNNYAKGYFTEGAELLPSLMDVLRKVAEECDLIQGFQFLHSVSGGSGGGLGSSLIDNVRTEYSDRIIKSYSIFPSLSMSQVVVEPYNAVLTMTHLIENTDETFCFDNSALFDICTKTLRLQSNTMEDINHIMAMVISGITTCFRFPGQLNMDLRKLAVNMIPFPTLHFLTTSFSPLKARSVQPYEAFTEQLLVQQMFDPKNQMLAVDPRQGKYFTATGIFRGRTLSLKLLHDLMAQMKQGQHFIEWIPNNCKVAHCDISPRGLSKSVTCIGNNTVIVKEFEHFLGAFLKLLNRRAYIHWFIGEGMEEMDFQEAEQRIKDLMNDYRQYEKVTIDNKSQMSETSESDSR